MFSTFTMIKKPLLLLLLTILLLGNTPLVLAQEIAPDGVAVTTSSTGVHVAWSAPVVSAANVESARTLLPVARHHGYDLPLQTITLAIPPDVDQTVAFDELIATPLIGGIEPGAPVTPPVLDWTPMPNILPDEPAQLPTAPAFILREGVIKGQRFAVLAISPIFEEAGVVKMATALRVHVPGATLLDLPLQSAAVAASNGVSAPIEEVVVPINQAALQNGYKIVVTQPGLQEVLFSSLTAGYDAAKLNLTHHGESIAVEVLADRFRFYAPTVGDRWNLNSVYWLTFDAVGKQMRQLQPGATGAATGQALERSVWRDNKIYVSEFPGFDGDRWFHTSLTAMGAMTQAQQAVTAPVTTTLPGAPGLTTFIANVTVVGSVPRNECTEERKVYKLRIEMLNSSGGVLETQQQEWNPSISVNNACRVQENWQVVWGTMYNPAAIRLSLLPSGVTGFNTSILLDSIEWERPISLNFAGNSASFWTPLGASSFTLAGLPAARALYDVTTPSSPEKILLGAGSQAAFEQQESATSRQYLLARLDSVATPIITPHSPVNFGDVLAANAIYIGPAQWRSAVQPLLTLRSSQGSTPLYVNVEDIFDVYGYGYVSAPAIRNFLRHRSDWQNPARTISVVLVGDGTYDPYNYRRTAFPSDSIFPVPPYMADVDIYINEVPCETCYAQLNGDDPVTGDDPDARNPKLNVFIPDVWVGRLPVRSESELTGLINKIVAYEHAGSVANWGGTKLLLAENYILSINEQNQVTVDPAGDFAAEADEVAATLGNGANVKRIYYDHSPDRRIDGTIATNGLLNTVERVPPEPWRISSIPDVRQQTIDAINAGAGLMVYNGHSNHWNYAKLEDRSGNGVSPLLSIIEANALRNAERLFFGLSMTCLTSQFAVPAVNGTLDELFVRNPNGGAIATWGPTGQGVVHGHKYLQRGFMTQLHASAGDVYYVGDLVTAGYNSLLTSPASNALDALKTFAILGDPLTNLRVSIEGGSSVFMPLVQR